MSIIVTADSSCDLPDSLLTRYGVEKFPLSIIQDGVPHRDNIEITPDDIYQHVQNRGSLPTTSAVNVADYLERFAQLSPAHDAVIHISIGSAFSSCHLNATIASKDFDNIYVVDSQNLSGGQGQVVWEACRLVDEGLPAQEIVPRLNDFTKKIVFSFLLDQVTYLHKGGRCSSVAALGANLLRLKPVIELRDGLLSVGKKHRGSFQKALSLYVPDHLANRDDLDLDRIWIISTGCPEEWLQQTEEEILQCTGHAPYGSCIAGCTICSHCGPKTLGIAAVKK